MEAILQAATELMSVGGTPAVDSVLTRAGRVRAALVRAALADTP